MKSNMGSENSVFYTWKLFYRSIVAGMVSLILLSIMFVNTIPAVAQIPPIPTEENVDGAQPSSTLTTNASNIPPPAIEITSLEDGQEVPVGELTIEGTSSDDQESNCQVYADVNDITPMQNATAAGNGGEADYSQWTFTYTQDYQSITKGSNELTAKISCFNANNPTPISKWHSVNITGISAGTGTSTATEGSAEPITSPLATNGTASSTEETVPDTDDGKNESI